MRRVLIPLLLVPIVLSGLSACVQTQKPSPFTGFYKNYWNCRQQYAEMDARVDAAGVRHASFWRVPGFPYLRSDRMLASFRNEVKGLHDVSEWTGRMRQFDQEARDYEYSNLGMTELERVNQRDRFLSCGISLAAIELADPETWARMVESVVPQDAYSTRARALGLYPITSISMRARTQAAQAAAMAGYQKSPTEGLRVGSEMRLWTVKPVENLSLIANAATEVRINDLGFPGLYGSQWRALAERHAPQFWIDTVDANDLPAAPAFEAQGLTANAARNRVNYLITYARFGKDLLVQISYFVWFKSPDGAQTGPVDGLIWRVTLDTQFRPMAYESLHASGNDHRWHPVQPLQARDQNGSEREPQFIAPEFAPAQAATLRLDSGTHALQRVVTAELADGASRHGYELRPYEELFTLALPLGGTHSLFGPDGLVTGTHGMDPVGGFSSGILQPGALRQYGHHAIVHVGRRHFDDPYLLEETFVPPPVPSPAAPAPDVVMLSVPTVSPSR